MISLFVFTLLASIICFFVFVIKAKFRKKKNILGAILGIFLSFVLILVTPTSDAKANPKENVQTVQLSEANKKVKTKPATSKKKKEAKEKAEAEKIAKEKVETERKAREEQEAKEKAEAERVAREEQEAREKAEAERVAREEQEAREKAEAERVAREEQEARERAEAERIAREEQIAREQAEAVSQQNERTVYIAPQSGSKYHYSSNCRGLKRANSISEISISEATSQGYDLCGFEK